MRAFVTPITAGVWRLYVLGTSVRVAWLFRVTVALERVALLGWDEV